MIQRINMKSHIKNKNVTNVTKFKKAEIKDILSDFKVIGEHNHVHKYKRRK